MGVKLSGVPTQDMQGLPGTPSRGGAFTSFTPEAVNSSAQQLAVFWDQRAPREKVAPDARHTSLGSFPSSWPCDSLLPRLALNTLNQTKNILEQLLS